MNIKQEFNHIKTLITQGSDLLLLRLRILRLDAAEQLASIIKILAAILVAVVLLLVGFIALLFGLNTILTYEAKIWVFFGLMVGCILVATGLLFWIPSVWRNSSTMMNDTLQALQDDLRLLNGISPQQEIVENDRKKSN